MKTNGPALVIRVLREQSLTRRVVYGDLPPGVTPHLASQHPDRIVAFIDRFAVPALDRGQTELNCITSDRVTPVLCRKLRKLGLQLALWGWRRQYLSNHGEAQLRPTLVNAGAVFVCHATHSAFIDRVRP